MSELSVPRVASSLGQEHRRMSESPAWLTGLLAEHGRTLNGHCVCGLRFGVGLVQDGDHRAHVADVIWAEITDRLGSVTFSMESGDKSRLLGRARGRRMNSPTPDASTQAFAPWLTVEQRDALVRKIADGPLRWVSREYADWPQIRLDKANEIVGGIEPLLTKFWGPDDD